VQLYRYFASQSSEFCHHNPLCCFSTSVYCCKRIFRYRLSQETFGYTLACLKIGHGTSFSWLKVSIRIPCEVVEDGAVYTSENRSHEEWLRFVLIIQRFTITTLMPSHAYHSNYVPRFQNTQLPTIAQLLTVSVTSFDIRLGISTTLLKRSFGALTSSDHLPKHLRGCIQKFPD
jgi:hypothetical protein